MPELALRRRVIRQTDRYRQQVSRGPTRQDIACRSEDICLVSVRRDVVWAKARVVPGLGAGPMLGA